MRFGGTTRLWIIFLGVLAGAGALASGPSGSSREAAWIEIRSPHFVVSSDAGEKQARRVADQFEQIRAVFHSAFSKLRVDPGQPILILAAKNEDSLKALLPAYWEAKGHVHPSGIFVAGPEKHYVALRVDVSGVNPYHAIYHEYTHALMDLNFRGLPLWLNEGLAEFYGNTALGDKEIRLGQFDEQHLLLLQQEKLIPIDVLLQVDHRSPYYNEKNRASVFYAESWALVHYLMVEPEPRKTELLSHFLQAFEKTGDQISAAAQSFGDLKKFAKQIENYVRQSQFHYARIKAPTELGDKDFAVRTLSAAETSALRGDFHVSMGRFTEAKALLDRAVQLDPRLPAAHESLGYYNMRKGDAEGAAKEFEEAVRLDSHSFYALYFHALLAARTGRYDAKTASEIQSSLEKAVKINPNFAPAYSALASFYLLKPETREQALAAALRAAQLEPGDLRYAMHLGEVLLLLNREEDAKALAARIQKAAKTTEEIAMAQSFQSRVENYQPFSPALAAEPDDGVAPAQITRRERKNTHDPEQSPPPTTAPAAPRIYSMFGRIGELSCAASREDTLTLSMSGITMRLHVTDAEKIEYTARGKSSNAAANPCAQWKGRSAQVSYTLTPGGSYDGEVTAISFP